MDETTLGSQPGNQIEQRIARLRASLREASLDALFVSQPESRCYLSGYKGHDLPPRDSAGYLLISGERLLLLTDPRTTEQATHEAPLYTVVEVRNGVAAALLPLVAESGLRRIGFEGIHLPYHLAQQITAALGDQAQFQETIGLIDALRVAKDALELTTLRAAIAVSDRCIEHLLGFLKPGMSEKEVAWEIERFMRTTGADALTFGTIVAAGPNAAMPHASPSDRIIAPGEPIVVDIGAKIGQYGSDITRTLCLGKPAPWLDEVYAIVLGAQQRAEAMVGAGMAGRDADALAREPIAAAGYGENFTHSLGHGIGLEPHEPPSLSARSSDVLSEGTVFSVEPGIYLPGVGGVRIEDLVWLGPGGPEILTQAPKGRQVLRL